MSFCYDTTRVSVRTESGPSNFDPLRCDAVKAYMRHYENSLFLTFMSNNGTLDEKHQAKKEMEICERKMKYWERQPHFNGSEANTKKARLHKTRPV